MIFITALALTAPWAAVEAAAVPKFKDVTSAFDKHSPSRQPAAPDPTGRPPHAGAVAPQPSSRWMELALQAVGAFATAAAAIFAAVSARGAVDAAKEMREARRASTIPRLSYRILDRALVISAGPGKRRMLTVTESEPDDDVEPQRGFTPRIELVCFAAPAVNVRAEVSFPPEGEDDLSFLRTFLGLGAEEKLELADFGISGPGYMIAARQAGSHFIPHLGAGGPHTLNLPFAIPPRYAVSVIHSLGTTMRANSNIFADLPTITMKLTFDSVEGDSYEQEFKFRYRLESFASPPTSIARLGIEELRSGRVTPVGSVGLSRSQSAVGS